MCVHVGGKTAFDTRQVVNSVYIFGKIFSIADENRSPASTDKFADNKIAGFIRKVLWVVVHPVTVIFAGITGPNNRGNIRHGADLLSSCTVNTILKLNEIFLNNGR